MTKQSQSIKVPAKIKKVILAYDRMAQLQGIFNRLRRISVQPMPKWKLRTIEAAESEAFMKFIGAQGNWRKLWDKLTKKDVAEAIKIRKAMEKGTVIKL